MKSVSTLSIISALSLALSSASVFAAEGATHPCADKGTAQHDARKAVGECLNTWAKSPKPGNPEPTDDCSAKVSAFIQATKTTKACRGEAAATRKAAKKP